MGCFLVGRYYAGYRDRSTKASVFVPLSGTPSTFHTQYAWSCPPASLLLLSSSSHIYADVLILKPSQSWIYLVVTIILDFILYPLFVTFSQIVSTSLLYLFQQTRYWRCCQDQDCDFDCMQFLTLIRIWQVREASFIGCFSEGEKDRAVVCIFPSLFLWGWDNIAISECTPPLPSCNKPISLLFRPFTFLYPTIYRLLFLCTLQPHPTWSPLQNAPLTYVLSDLTS